MGGISMMNLTSCEGCGVVLDKGQLYFPHDLWGDDGQIREDLSAYVNGKYYLKLPCPVCGEDIVDGDVVSFVVKNLLATTFGFKVEDLCENDHLEIDLGLDSVDFVDALMVLEDTFEVEFNKEEEESINTVKDIVNLIKLKLEGKNI